LKGVRLDIESGPAFDFPEYIVGKFHIKIFNCTCLQAGEMAVWVVPIPIKTSMGSIETLDHPCTLECFQILINGGMADLSALLIEFLKNVSSTEVTGFAPQQIEHHSPLSAQSHSQMSATIEGILKGALVMGSLGQK
tara:strand:+ start:488 stop:898 length:411 start_codon:yes stop_codon:yes gene_type:complete